MTCVTSVTVSPSSFVLNVGESKYLSATVCPIGATCNCVTWRSSNANVASVNATSGLVLARSEGTVTIYATAQDGSGKQGSASITVTNTVKVTSVSLSNKCLSLDKGSSYCLTATVSPSNATNRSLTWSSSNTNIASVSNGRVYAISKGSANIFATATDGSGAYDCCNVTVVEPIEVTSVSVSPSDLTLNVGESRSLSALICPPDASCTSVAWRSSNANVASVNAASGQVLARSEGTATIYATAQDGSGKQGSASVTVMNNVKVTSICLSSKCLSLKGGETHRLTATINPSNAKNRSVEWSSSNERVATVKDGIVTAVAKGAATIYATARDGSGVRDCCDVTVTADVLVSSIQINRSSTALKVGESEQLFALVSPMNATNCALTWTSNNPCVATVNATSGQILGVGEGTAIITATAKDGSGVLDRCMVTVYIPVSSVSISPKTTSMYIGDQVSLNTTVSPNNATYKLCNYSSSNNNVAKVNNLGEVTAVGEGNAIITVTSSSDHGKSATCMVTVKSRAIIIIPGYMGTELKVTKRVCVSMALELFPFLDGYVEANTKVWPPISGGNIALGDADDAYKNLCALECDSNGEGLYPIAPVEGQKYGSFDTYKTIYDRLHDKYFPDWHIEFFGYDWRMSNADSAAKLDKFITDKGFESVILIAHSNGGLVASNYLATFPNQHSKVKKLITLSSPLKGSLEVLPTMLTGDFKSMPLPEWAKKIGVDDLLLCPMLQNIIVNLPSAYELLPPEQFFRLGRSYLSCNLFGDVLRLTTYEDTMKHLSEHVSNWNSSLMGTAEKANARLWRSQGTHITDSVDTYYFAAYGVETVSEYQYNISLRNSLEEKAITSIGGDGTVLIISSGLDYRYADRTFYSEKTTHTGNDSANGLDGILDATKIWTMIQRIIDEEELSTNLPKGISTTPPEMYI